MKNKAFTLLVLLILSCNLLAQDNVDKKIIDINRKTQQQLNASLKSANTLIVTGSILAIGGAAVTAIAIDNYSRKSEGVNTDNGVIENQVGMNKTIPAAILGLGGAIVSGVGISVLTKGIIHKNNIKLELIKYSYTSSIGLGVKLNF